MGGKKENKLIGKWKNLKPMTRRIAKWVSIGVLAILLVFLTIFIVRSVMYTTSSRTRDVQTRNFEIAVNETWVGSQWWVSDIANNRHEADGFVFQVNLHQQIASLTRPSQAALREISTVTIQGRSDGASHRSRLDFPTTFNGLPITAITISAAPFVNHDNGITVTHVNLNRMHYLVSVAANAFNGHTANNIEIRDLIALSTIGANAFRPREGYTINSVTLDNLPLLFSGLNTPTTEAAERTNMNAISTIVGHRLTTFNIGSANSWLTMASYMAFVGLRNHGFRVNISR